MPKPVPVPGHDERWADPIETAPPPAGDHWTDRDIDRLCYDAMTVLGLSLPDARGLLARNGGDYTPGQLRAVLDSEVLA